MTTEITAAFEVKSWDEKEIDEQPGHGQASARLL